MAKVTAEQIGADGRGCFRCGQGEGAVHRADCQEATKRYQDCGLVGSLHMWNCLECGSLVVSRGQHDHWHEGA